MSIHHNTSKDWLFEIIKPRSFNFVRVNSVEVVRNYTHFPFRNIPMYVYVYLSIIIVKDVTKLL